MSLSQEKESAGRETRVFEAPGWVELVGEKLQFTTKRDFGQQVLCSVPIFIPWIIAAVSSTGGRSGWKVTYHSCCSFEKVNLLKSSSSSEAQCTCTSGVEECSKRSSFHLMVRVDTIRSALKLQSCWHCLAWWWWWISCKTRYASHPGSPP